MWKWISLLPVWAIGNFLAMLLAPLVACFYVLEDGPIDNNNGTGVEPRVLDCFSWFRTPDNSLLGDGAWKRMEPDHWDWRAKFIAYPKFQAYLGRLGWLWRNPAYGFELSVLSAKLDSNAEVDFEGSPFIQDKPNGLAGKCVVNIGPYWNYNSVTRIGDRCIKLNFGWKLKTYAEDPSRLKEDPIAQYSVGIGLKSFVVSS